MIHIHYKDIILSKDAPAEAIDDQAALSLEQFAQISGHHPDWILQLVEYDILTVMPVQNRAYQFFSHDILRARRAYRLQRDFDANLAAVAVMMDLIDEVQSLRRQVQQY